MTKQNELPYSNLPLHWLKYIKEALVGFLTLILISSPVWGLILVGLTFGRQGVMIAILGAAVLILMAQIVVFCHKIGSGLLNERGK